MLSKKLKTANIESKLSKTLTEINAGQNQEKTGFIKNPNKSSAFKTKSFRLREADFANLLNIAIHINKNNDRMIYSDSQIIRGIINYMSENLEGNIKKIMPYIKSSS